MESQAMKQIPPNETERFNNLFGFKDALGKPGVVIPDKMNNDLQNYEERPPEYTPKPKASYRDSVPPLVLEKPTSLVDPVDDPRVDVKSVETTFHVPAQFVVRPIDWGQFQTIVSDLWRSFDNKPSPLGFGCIQIDNKMYDHIIEQGYAVEKVDFDGLLRNRNELKKYYDYCMAALHNDG